MELVVPNEVMRGLYVERIRQLLMPLGASRTAADTILFAFLRSGDLEPLLDFIRIYHPGIHQSRSYPER